MGSLFIDVTEFVTNPIRTGIQRVIRELLGRWPADIPRRVVWFDDRVGGLVPVREELLAYLIDSPSDPVLDGEQTRRKSLDFLASTTPPALDLRREDRVLVPELFASRARALFYRRLQGRQVSIRAIVYDILAWTQPDALNITTVGPFNDYLEFLKVTEARCHISSAVRDAYTQRVLRRPGSADTVIVLGADALGRRPADLPVLPQLLCPGALDGRKGQDRIFDAYMAMPEADRLPLIIAGRVPPEPRESIRRILDSSCPTVSVIDDPDDTRLSELIAGSQGCLFPSQFEGFGLPALESLYLGTPVVIDANLPAVSGLPAAGQIRLESQSRDDLVRALRQISDPASAAALRQAAATLQLPTWADYAGQVAAWASQ
ncbi:glycosyltransferase [Brevundimonas subvibrioides]|uniref:Glycosyl transferase group 1 n=1 Tax=Brevundimonas subvibrioides (strain ATCC 15264 / DSM 4735 / LMG 14903 / NBRC 16000 / CB 81) TaxID=633149 RepID=D9QG45_BRESC|nr:glycosyltransferase [Brevundimonas subvibrioides]ADL02587.1 glycosyl transferase group 1 [Brevundimonas subvibrioides ATCC 15264]